MPTCDQCGEEIEFRYLDGRPTPIHVNGGWCQGFTMKKPASAKGWFRTAEAFTDPNALCPVCGAGVFYYQNSSGSRVFFDNRGWPWSKHPCTDNPASQAGEIKRPDKKGRSVRVAAANQTTLYELVDCNESCGLFSAKFRNIASPLITYTLRLPVSDFQSQGWTEDDLRDAPSFIIKLHPDQTVVEFISIRKSAMGRLVVPRTAKGK